MGNGESRKWCPRFAPRQSNLDPLQQNLGQCKADVLHDLHPILYIGDNSRIDEMAAVSAKVPYADVGVLMLEFLRLQLEPIGVLWRQYVLELTSL